MSVSKEEKQRDKPFSFLLFSTFSYISARRFLGSTSILDPIPNIDRSRRYSVSRLLLPSKRLIKGDLDLRPLLEQHLPERDFELRPVLDEGPAVSCEESSRRAGRRRRKTTGK
jgi:hypothetical protein